MNNNFNLISSKELHPNRYEIIFSSKGVKYKVDVLKENTNLTELIEKEKQLIN